jgi:hypothetical protein
LDADSDGDLPDACTFLTRAQLITAFGDPGNGEPAGGGSRNVCFFDSGLIVGVSDASQFDSEQSLDEGGGAECSEVPGVGDRATFCITGNVVGTLRWIDGAVMYDVTAGSIDQADFIPLATKS